MLIWMAKTMILPNLMPNIDCGVLLLKQITHRANFNSKKTDKKIECAFFVWILLFLCVFQFCLCVKISNKKEIYKSLLLNNCKIYCLLIFVEYSHICCSMFICVHRGNWKMCFCCTLFIGWVLSCFLKHISHTWNCAWLDLTRWLALDASIREGGPCLCVHADWQK